MTFAELHGVAILHSAVLENNMITDLNVDRDTVFYKLTRKPKTRWQKVYSFFGFWTYKEVIFDRFSCYERVILYWELFPFYYLRKLDLLVLRTREIA